jgi:hypothetical protein
MDHVIDAMCTHGDKVERHEARLGDLMVNFNENIKEFQETTDLFTITHEDTHDRLKGT